MDTETKPGRSVAMPRVGQVHDHLSMSDGSFITLQRKGSLTRAPHQTERAFPL